MNFYSGYSYVYIDFILKIRYNALTKSKISMFQRII